MAWWGLVGLMAIGLLAIAVLELARRSNKKVT